MGRNYTGLRITVILCGTDSLRLLDSSELGERFIRVYIMESIDDAQEDAILWRVANRSARNLSVESNGEAMSHYEPERATAMALTGGYVNWLRENATDIIGTIGKPEWALRQCARLGKFVAHLRARPSKHQEERSGREFATRLVAQYVRLAGCLALVLNRSSIDTEIMRRVRRAAMETSAGNTLDIFRKLYGTEDGMTADAIANGTVQPDEKTRFLLRFMRQIGIVEVYTPETGIRGLNNAKPKWILTEKLRQLYNEILIDDPEDLKNLEAT
jgi:hypothetical protein